MLATGETGVAIRQNPLALAMGRMSMNILNDMRVYYLRILFAQYPRDVI